MKMTYDLKTKAFIHHHIAKYCIGLQCIGRQAGQEPYVDFKYKE